jgi:hypothetical protein
MGVWPGYLANKDMNLIIFLLDFDKFGNELFIIHSLDLVGG